MATARMAPAEKFPTKNAPQTRSNRGAVYKRTMQGRSKGGAKLKGQGFDPSTGRKVFKNEFRSGFKMAKAAGLSTGAPNKQLGGMQQRLNALDAGKATGKPGERSFLRGALHAASGGKGGG